MDDRYFFFALADPDYFDVPGAGDHPEIPVPVDLVGSFRREVAGPWAIFQPHCCDLPEAGWKIHVSATPEHAQRAVAIVARVCAARQVAWKMLRTQRLVHMSQHKYAPRSLSGKICVLYPRTDEESARLVDQLAGELDGVVGPRITGDHPHPTAPLGVRWGAYREHWLESADGRRVPGVLGQDGLVADDRQRPLPNLPSPLATALRAVHRSEPLPVTDVRLVHRCNGGSVYDARLTDGRHVALKEARRHAGLDGGGADSVTRLRHEYAVLRRLSGTRVAPEPVDYWEGDQSDILVMEWVEGESLAARVSREHPNGRPGVSAEQAGEFFEWAGRVSIALKAKMERMRQLGVAHGDLHPGNIVVSQADPVLVDFEAATLDRFAVTLTIGTPGFHSNDPDPVVRDQFGLDSTLANLWTSEVPLADRRPDVVPTGSRPCAAAPQSDAPSDTEALVARLADCLVERSTPHRTDRLFCGGIEQFTSPLGGHNILSGAAGVLLALHSIGREPDPRHLDWLASLPDGRGREIHGLAEGVEGIALSLALLGRREQASDLIDGLAVGPPQGLSWTRGQAGHAVALIELGRLLERDDLVDRGLTAAEVVRLATYDDAQRVASPGLLEGWAGIALSLLRVGELIPEHEQEFVAGGSQAIHRERQLLRLVNGHLVATPSGRARIGLGHGSAAFTLALEHSRDAGARSEHSEAAAAALRTIYWPAAGLLDGLAGTAVTLRALGDVGAARLLEDRVGHYCVPTSRGWSTLGSARLRCSDDLMTGSAGLIVALGDGSVERLAQVLRLPTGLPRATPNDTCHDASLAPATVDAERVGV